MATTGANVDDDALIVVNFVPAGRLGISFDVWILDEHQFGAEVQHGEGIEASAGELFITAIAPGSLAAALPQLHAGLVLKKVQGADVKGMPADDVLDLLRCAERPLQLAFAEDGGDPCTD